MLLKLAALLEAPLRARLFACLHRPPLQSCAVRDGLRR